MLARALARSSLVSSDGRIERLCTLLSCVSDSDWFDYVWIVVCFEVCPVVKASRLPAWFFHLGMFQAQVFCCKACALQP